MNKRFQQITKGNRQGGIFLEDIDSTKQIENFPPGVYSLTFIGSIFDSKPCYTPLKLEESYIISKNGVINEVLKKASDFFSDGVIQKHKDLGIIHKTSILLYGKPGTGKTVTARLIMEELVKKYNAICLCIDHGTEPAYWLQAIKELRLLDNPLILFVDEAEAQFNYYENEWLTFLDGHKSVGNFMLLASTNFIDKISTRIKRPSRLEHKIKIDCIESEMAEQYLLSKLPNIEKNLRAGLVYTSIECKVSIDSFKNAVKSFYIKDFEGGVEAFKEILSAQLDHEQEELEELEED